MSPKTLAPILVQVLAALFLLVTPITAPAQRTFRITEISTRFYPPEKLDSLTRAALYKEAQTLNIGAASFNERYISYRSRVTDFIYAMLIVPYSQLDLNYGDKRPQPGSAEYEEISKRYEAQALKAIERILANPGSIHPILQKDESDRILFFQSELIVSKDGKIDVTETIRVYNGDGSTFSQNDEIKHGILRDFPSKILDSTGYWVRTGFDIISVSLDGEKAPYKTQPLQYGTRVMIGEESEYLSKGVHTYVIRYSTNRQILFHPNRDELYWNVTGNGWSFSIDTVIARIQFPAEAEIDAQQCYTGSRGSTSQDCKWEKQSGESIEFSTGKGLLPYEGLTIAADIQKGVLIEPGAFSKFWNIILSNWIVPLLILMVVGVFLFYFRIWNRKGRDPKSEGIALQSSPPQGLGPADVGYIHQQQYGPHLFIAELIYASVHGQLEIEINKGSSWLSGTSYSFRQPAQPPKPVPFSQYTPLVAVNHLYGHTLQSRGYNSTFRSLYTALETFLKNRYQIQKGSNHSARGYFALNRGSLYIGIIIAVLAALASIYFLALNFTPLLGIISAVMLVILIAVLIVFYRLLPAYTPEGRKIADHVEGFRRYLLSSGDKTFKDLTPYDTPLNLFERYLPYAIALKVENAWAKGFESLLNSALTNGYRPSYFYPGRSFVRPMSFTDFSSGITSGLSSSISSASSSPSSSGSRGGGFSGGGGGGGGGGGW